MPEKKLRLLSVVVQPHYVIDDGEHLVDASTQPITVPSAEWPKIVKELERARLSQEARINTDDTAEPGESENDSEKEEGH